MISDRETNTVYFSELIKEDSRFKETSRRIFSKLDLYNIAYKLLPDTKDIWARDYMPVQVNSSKFVEYRYDPDYLQGDGKGRRDLKTYPDIVCDSLNLKTQKCNLILDGGNIVRSSDCIILTDKVVKENRHSYSKDELIRKLHETFQVNKVVLIPWDKRVEYGHSDGILRFIDNETVLVSHYYRFDKVLLYRLDQAGLKPVFFDFKVKRVDKRNWAYINFLQTKELILLPKFGIEEDNQAYEQIGEYYTDYRIKGRIEQIDMSEIVIHGGALNCISWATKE